jgi:hypothetical protein
MDSSAVDRSFDSPSVLIMNQFSPFFASALFLAGVFPATSKGFESGTAALNTMQLPDSGVRGPEWVMDPVGGGGGMGTRAFWDAVPALEEYDGIGYEKWLNRMNDIMTAVKNGKMTRDESIEILSTLYLYNSNILYFCPPDSEEELRARTRREETAVEMLKILCLIPNLEKSYAECIRTALLVKKRVKVAQPIYFRRWLATELTRPGNEWKNFSMLSRLATPEAVRILGEFLNDPAMSPVAAKSLLDMPLKAKPAESNLEGEKMSSEEIQLWKDWYGQVKSGQRTFSFESDPQEYDLNGPKR